MNPLLVLHNYLKHKVNSKPENPHLGLTSTGSHHRSSSPLLFLADIVYLTFSGNIIEIEPTWGQLRSPYSPYHYSQVEMYRDTNTTHIGKSRVLVVACPCGQTQLRLHGPTLAEFHYKN